jgi:hypothetical protein
MKRKSKLLIGSLIVISYLIIGTVIHNFITSIDIFDTEYANTIFRNYYFRYAIHYIYFILFGIVIGLDKLIEESDNDGKWKFKWDKLLIQGIPMIYIASQFFLYFNPSETIRKFSHVFFIKHEYIILLALVANGYIFITSIKKE